MTPAALPNPITIATHNVAVHGRINLPPTADAPDTPRFDPTEAAKLYVEEIGTISSADLGTVRVRITLTVEHGKSDFCATHIAEPKARIAIHVLDTSSFEWKSLHHRTFQIAFVQTAAEAAKTEGNDAGKRRSYPGTCHAIALRRLMRNAETAAATETDPTKPDMTAAWKLALTLLG